MPPDALRFGPVEEATRHSFLDHAEHNFHALNIRNPLGSHNSQRKLGQAPSFFSQPSSKIFESRPGAGQAFLLTEHAEQMARLQRREFDIRSPQTVGQQFGVKLEFDQHFR